MFQIPDMSTRLFRPELMDDTGGPEDELFRTLRQFRTVNRLFSRYRTLVKRYLVPHMKRQGNREIVVADIGAGGCDFALWFTRFCRARGIGVKVLCIDNDPRAVRFAREACRGHDNIAVNEASAFSIDTIDGPIDYIFSNHFLHHIGPGEIPGLLRTIHDRALCGFLISDLARSRAAYAGFTLFCNIFFRTRQSCHDGRLSIRKGFLKNEMADLVAASFLSAPVTIGTMHPGRIFLWCVKQKAVTQRGPQAENGKMESRI
jgi:SAM-dependent methyltransferase